MTALTIKNRVEDVLVIGPLYDRIDRLSEAQKHFEDYDLVIFNGNLCFPSDNLSEVEHRIQEMSQVLNSKIVYNVGRYDLQLLTKLRRDGIHDAICSWIAPRPNVIIVPFRTGNTLIVTDGGVTPEMKLADLSSNLETSFVSKIKDSSWHRWYGGGMGYIISNNPLTTKPPQYYNFSAQIGNVYCEKVLTYAQAVTGPGLAAEKLIGLFGDQVLDYDLQTKLLSEVLTKYSDLEGSPVEMSLHMEKDFLKFSQQAYNAFEDEGRLTLGLDDMIMAIASTREESVYLLQQKLLKE
ncbi:unnamed protein product [Sphagnum balticum]